MGGSFTAFAALLTGAGVAIFTCSILISAIMHQFDVHAERAFGWLQRSAFLGACFTAAGTIAAAFA